MLNPISLIYSKTWSTSTKIPAPNDANDNITEPKIRYKTADMEKDIAMCEVGFIFNRRLTLIGHQLNAD